MKRQRHLAVAAILTRLALLLSMAALAATLAGLLLSAPALATTIRRMELPEIAAASETIVRGRVEKVRSFWEGKQILTEATLVVERALKGPRVDRLTVVQLGGIVSEPFPVGMTVPGAPIHAVGDEGYYFLQPASGGRHVIVGLSLGRVRVMQGPEGEYVGYMGRCSPAEFEEEIRRILAGQAMPSTGSGGRH